jgi:hypothetical protein
MTHTTRFSLFLFLILFVATAAVAAEIREFDIKTIERLGNELYRVSQTRDKGATTSVRKRAQQTAMAALKGKLFNIRYDYVVLDDPDGSGFLVYALAHSKNEIVLCGHFRVTVSPDGRRAERVDALSHTLLFAPAPPRGTKAKKPLTVSMSQAVSTKPLEISIYTSLHDKVIVFVGMLDGTVWSFVGD